MFAEIHNNLIEGQSLPYSWSAKLRVRHLNPAKDSKEIVQFGNVNVFSDIYEAEAVVLEKVLAGFAIEFPGFDYDNLEVWKFDKASDGNL